jgi:hypothetical protein
LFHHICVQIPGCLTGRLRIDSPTGQSPATLGREHDFKVPTFRVLVVRPDQFAQFIEAGALHHVTAVVQLPENTPGIGYARFWTQVIATSLGLDFVWMVDDSVKSFYEYIPGRIAGVAGNRRKFDMLYLTTSNRQS